MAIGLKFIGQYLNTTHVRIKNDSSAFFRTGDDGKIVSNEENMKDLAKLFVAQIPKKLNDELLNDTKEDILSLGYPDIGPQQTQKWKCRLPYNSRYQEGDEIKIKPYYKDIRYRDFRFGFMKVENQYCQLTYDSILQRFVTWVKFTNTSNIEHFEGKNDFKIGTIMFKNENK